MDINRLKKLSGIQNKTPDAPTTVSRVFEDIKLTKERDFKALAKIHEAAFVQLKDNGLSVDAVVKFNGENAEIANQKLKDFSLDWKLVESNRAILEGHKVYPVINSDEYPPIVGLEGPFRYESGKVLYYAPKIGKYYDSKTDTYLSAEDMEYHRNPVPVRESEEEILPESMTDATKQAMNEAEDDKKSNEESEELKDACWDGYEAIGTKKKDGKTVPNCVPVNEDHGKGFYVMVDGKEHCWCESRKEAEEKAQKLKGDGKKVTIVPDKDIKEAIVDNFVQDDTDKDNTVAKRTGTDAMMNTKIKIPQKVKAAVNARIAELKKSIEFYDEKGYNDDSQKQKAIDCLQQIMDDLEPSNIEALKKAQVFYSTLMSPITDLIPSQLVLFLANAESLKEQEDKSRAAVLKRHIAYHEDQMRVLDKEMQSYKDHAKALERYKKELAQYE